MTRFEAAALLNACLDRVTEKTDELQKLLDEFDKELTILTARVDGLESKVGKLQAQQFSTTTKLRGEASMILGGIPGYNTQNSTTGANTGRQGNTTFNYDLRLNFDTSYTGQDLLRTRLRSGNFAEFPFGSSSTPFKLDKAEKSQGSASGTNSNIWVDRLYYTFPVGSAKTTKITVGALVRNTEMAWLPTAYKSDVLDVFTTIGTTGVYNKATGQGFGIQWQQKVEKGKPFFVANANYVSLNGNQSDLGVFNSKGGSNVMAQLGYKANNWGAAFGYRYGTQGSAVRDGNGQAGTAMGLDQSSNSIAFNAYWQPTKTGFVPSLSAGYAYNFVSDCSGTGNGCGSNGTGALSSKSWFVGLQWDNAFIKGNAAGVAFGQPSYASGNLQGAPWLIEWFYRFQVSDNISITPTLFYGSGIANSSNSAGSSAAGNSQTGSTFDGLGGVIQTTFKF
jgi:hypothetical protein